MTPRQKRTTPKTYERRIRTQRQREEEELENTNLKKSIEEEREHEIDVSSTNVERDDRAVEEEQDDIAIPEKETSPIVESSPFSPSPDNFIVKSIRYANYNLESMIDRYPNLRGSLTVKSELRKLSKFRTILEKQKLAKFFRSSIFGNYLQLEDRIRFQMSLVYELLRRQIIAIEKKKFGYIIVACRFVLE
uniref:Uncharacterized protein n=1 Tax=Solanum tuberosum TaxID=4113 RepID=M1DUS3_SOLTU